MITLALAKVALRPLELWQLCAVHLITSSTGARFINRTSISRGSLWVTKQWLIETYLEGATNTQREEQGPLTCLYMRFHPRTSKS